MAKKVSVTPSDIAADSSAVDVTSAPTRLAKRVNARKARPKATKAVKAATKPAKATQRASSRAGGTKQDKLVALLRRPQGASVAEMMKLTGWQAHSLRGVMSGALTKKLGLKIISEKNEKTGERRYHIAALRDDAKRA